MQCSRSPQALEISVHRDDDKTVMDAIARFRLSRGPLLLVILAIAMLAGCQLFASPAASKGPDVLPAITLIDQNGHPVELSSLRGKPILFDFIYTTCPGPCLVITNKMKAIAEALGPKLGSEVRFVSVSVDPEHDTPTAMLNYAREMHITTPAASWLFLTGSPQNIDSVMKRFRLRRVRESNGAIDHVLEFFLVGADGHLLAQYVAVGANATKIASDLERVASGQELVLSTTGGTSNPS
jgi:protein SCO1/2